VGTLVKAWVAKGYRGGYFDQDPEIATFQDVAVGDEIHEQHDPAQDWIEDFKIRHPTGWVVMCRVGQEAMEHRVYVEDRVDGIFSSMHDADAWVHRWHREWYLKSWRYQLVTTYFPEREPVVRRRTAWERLVED